jgi:hypothetical protein
MPQCGPQWIAVRFLTIIAVLFGASEIAIAEDVPLPRSRPTSLGERLAVAPQQIAAVSVTPALELQGIAYPSATPGPTACELRLAGLATFKPLPTLIGPGACGASDVVRLEAIVMPDKTQVTVSPAATLRCGMAESLALWIRNDVAPAVATLGAPLAEIANYDSFNCRGRNRIIGARLSEHGKANALDIRALKLTNGTVIEPTSPIVSMAFRETMRNSACEHFMTVLGPGSDGYHETHVHVDLAERARGYRVCQWDVREPPIAMSVPLPVPRPTALRAQADRKAP